MCDWAEIDEGEPFDEEWFDRFYVNTLFADSMVAANPEMIPDDPDVLRKSFAQLLADTFVRDAEMQISMNLAMIAVEDMMNAKEQQGA